MSEETKKYQDRHKYLKEIRKEWEDQYKEISEYMLPRKGFFFDKDPNKGDTRNEKIVDGLATRSLRVLSAGLQAGLTSPSRPWFRLSLERKEWLDHPTVKMWLAEIEKRLRHALAQSNFYQAAHNLYTEISGFGTGVIHIQRGMRKALHFKPLTVGEYCIADDPDGRVDTIYRELSLTAKQAIQEFGEDKVSAQVKKIYDRNPYEYVKIVHAVQPNKDRKLDKIDNQNKAWESVYYEEDFDQKILRKSGYDSFPFACPRWDINGGDVYGRGPGMDCLPDVKMLQAQTKSIIKAIQLAVSPPLKASGDLKGRINLFPGAVSYLNEGQLEEIIKSRPDIQSAILAREDVRNAIREGFFNDLFLLLTQPDRDTTATEIMERKEEKMLMLGPIVERQHTEFADVIIEQSLDILMDDPDFPVLPDELMHEIGDYKIEYVSTLAQAQKMAGTQAIQRTMEFAGSLLQVYPELRHKINPDEALDTFHDLVGAPVELINSDDVVKQLREAEQQQQQEMQQAEQAAMAQSVKGQAIQNQKAQAESVKIAGDALKGAAETDVQALMENLNG
jgi:hypothetical protein